MQPRPRQPRYEEYSSFQSPSGRLSQKSGKKEPPPEPHDINVKESERRSTSSSSNSSPKLRGDGQKLTKSTRRSIPQRSRHHDEYSAATSHLKNDQYLDAFEDGYEALAAAAVRSQPNTIIPQNQQQKAMCPSSRQDNIKRTPDAHPVDDHPDDHPMFHYNQPPVNPAGECIQVSERNLTCLSLAPDHKSVVVGSCDHQLYHIDLQTFQAKPIRSNNSGKGATSGHREWITSVCHVFSNDVLVSGAMDSRICVWTTTRGAEGNRRRRSQIKGSSSTGSSFRCTQTLEGHTGSISHVLPLSSNQVLSSSYDKTIRLWNLGLKSSSLAVVFRGHAAPILELKLLPDHQTFVSGDRSGHVMLWDCSSPSPLQQLSSHDGHITSLAVSRDTLAVGAQDGVIKIYDRQELEFKFELVTEIPLYRQSSEKKKSGKSQTSVGAVTHLSFTSPPSSSSSSFGSLSDVYTAGANGIVHVLDSRKNYEPRESWTTQASEFIYAMHVVQSSAGKSELGHSTTTTTVVLTGDGSGNVVAHEVRKTAAAVNDSDIMMSYSKCQTKTSSSGSCYGLGANQAAIRAMEMTDCGQLIAAGDDGNVMVYQYSRGGHNT